MSRLPLEVFDNILVNSFDRSHPAYTKDLHHLATVSYSWWQRVKHLPALWAYIDVERDEKTVSVHLRKSGAVPLYVNIPKLDCLCIGNGRYEYHNGGFDLQGIADQSHRWKSFETSSLHFFTKLPTPLAEALSKSTPLLSDIRLRGSYDKRGVYSAPLDVIVIAGGASVRHLEISRYCATIHPDGFSNLTTLMIEYVPRFERLEGILRALEASPQLATLSLGPVYGTYEESYQLRNDPITLDNLIHLTLRCGDTCLIRSCLLRIQAPRLERADFECGYRHEGEGNGADNDDSVAMSSICDAFFGTFVASSPSHFAAIMHNGSVALDIELGRDGVETHSTPSPSWGAVFGGLAAVGAMKQAIGLCTPDQQKKTSIALKLRFNYSASVDGLPALFRAMPNIRSLYAEGCRRHLIGVIDALSGYDQASKGFLLPSVQRLDFDKSDEDFDYDDDLSEEADILAYMLDERTDRPGLEAITTIQFGIREYDMETMEFRGRPKPNLRLLYRNE